MLKVTYIMNWLQLQVQLVHQVLMVQMAKVVCRVLQGVRHLLVHPHLQEHRLQVDLPHLQEHQVLQDQLVQMVPLVRLG